MSFQSHPSKSGVYRIKCLTENLYIESIPQSETAARYGRPWMRLVPPTGNKKQEWILVKNGSTWTIQSAFDNAGLIYIKTSDTYHGHGYAYPGGDSIDWKIIEYNRQYSRISAPANGSDVFDSEYRETKERDYTVHFWHKLNGRDGRYQCYVFEFVSDVPTQDQGNGSTQDGEDEVTNNDEDEVTNNDEDGPTNNGDNNTSDNDGELKLDVVFLQDATGSQQPYIDAARDCIVQICTDLKQTGQFRDDSDLRFRVVTFRDHPPQEKSFVVQPVGGKFTSNVATVQTELASIVADGGGDGPEAVADALDEALNSNWRDDAAKVVVLVTDAPPHGVEDTGDGFPDGCPLQLDPVRTINLFIDNDISLNVIACEPILSSDYGHAHEFYKGMTDKTGGDFVPLGDVGKESKHLYNAFVGVVSKSLDTQRLASKLASRIRAQAHREKTDLISDLLSDLTAQGVQHTQVVPADIYASNEQSAENVKHWAAASTIKDAKGKIGKVDGDRIQPQHRGEGKVYEVSYKKAPITRANLEAVTSKVFKDKRARDRLPIEHDPREYHGRGIIPLHPELLGKSAATVSERLLAHPKFGAETSKVDDDFELPDLDDVQGDIIYLFPKRAENFIFFRISNAASFRAALGKFKPSTSKDTADFIHELAERKRRAGRGVKIPIIPKSNVQIAFSRIGLNVLGVTGPTGDQRFDKYAMRDNKPILGDQSDWDPVFNKPNFNPVNGSLNDDTGAIHGVFTVAGSDPKTCNDASNDVKKLFGASMSVMATVEGRARPGEFAGHEHFGYLDGVSQPALRHLTLARKGQLQVDPGVIILGYKGDPVVDDPDSTIKRSSWTKGGTIMVFRKLEQDVPEFRAYCDKNGPRWREFAPPGCPKLSNSEGSELWGARMIGRWKSGAPLATCPFKDDPELAKDKDKTNDFDYRVRGVTGVSEKAITDYYCPFTAHTRKTAPRDLDPLVQRRYLESGVIVRAGLPYGPEVTPEEARLGKTSKDVDKKRGLLFVCYQSSLDGGFLRQTLEFAGNNYFPTASLIPQYHGPDPIIGGPPPKGSIAQVNEVTYVIDPKNPPVEPKTGDQVNFVVNYNGNQISVSGFADVLPAGAVSPPGVPQDFFVTSRGGEYFFVPPLSALQDWAAGRLGSDGSDNSDNLDGTGSRLDLMLVLDATSSMQKYIDQARTSLKSVLDGIVSSGKYSPSDIRVGLIAFRDHPHPDRRGGQQTFEFISKPYGFESDIDVVKTNLESLEASGGGDGPEAQCDALADAYNASWRDDATKITILLTDAPPHGVGEYEDKIPDGCPLGNDCVRLANLMADAGITLHVFACEPTLSGSYSKAHDFYEGITRITGGKMVALVNEATLRDLLVGSVAESSDIRKYAVQYKNDIAAQAEQGATATSISQNLYSRLSSEGVQVDTFAVESIYAQNTDGDFNANVWANAKQVDDATKAKLRRVRGFRVKQDFRPGGASFQKAQQMRLVKQPVSQSQVDDIVNAGLRITA